MLKIHSTSREGVSSMSMVTSRPASTAACVPTVRRFSWWSLNSFSFRAVACCFSVVFSWSLSAANIVQFCGWNRLNSDCRRGIDRFIDWLYECRFSSGSKIKEEKRVNEGLRFQDRRRERSFLHNFKIFLIFAEEKNR